MQPELGFKVEVTVHQAEEAEERGWGMEKKALGVGVRKREEQRHENIGYFSTEYSETHEEFRADSSNECFILLTHSFSWTAFECKSWFSILDLIDFAPRAWKVYRLV